MVLYINFKWHGKQCNMHNESLTILRLSNNHSPLLCALYRHKITHLQYVNDYFKKNGAL